MRNEFQTLGTHINKLVVVVAPTVIQALGGGAEAGVLRASWTVRLAGLVYSRFSERLCLRK